VSLADQLATQPSPTVALGKLAELLERNGISPEDIGKIAKVNLWQGFHKTEDGDAEVVDLAGISFSPAWSEPPAWPVCQPAAPTIVRPVKAAPKATDARVVVILPDPQIGYRRLADGTLVPCHDEAAIEVALQITRAARPDMIVNLGDTLDLPEWSSKFLVLPEFVLTTQPTIDEAHRFLARQRAIAPEAEIKLLAGNHDDRLGISIAKNAMAALRLRQAEAPESWPVLSMPHLLRLDDLGVEYVGAYPAGRIEIARGNDTITPLYAIHGEKLDVAKVARAERQSFVQGHIHRQALHTETYEVRRRPETVVAFSPGCLCRVDGAVPSTKSGVDDATGAPYERWENWQQGCAVVTEQPDGYWSVELVQIHHGRATWRGKEYRA
jgi:hypothetical protein